MDQRAKADRLTRWTLAAALLIGLVRFWRLGTWGIWIDEAFTLNDTIHRAGIANPAGYLLHGMFYELAGGRPDELVLRIPAAVAGWLCLPATYWAVRPLVGRRGAAVGAAILAVAAWHVYWSQTARFYTLAQLLGLLGGGLFVRGLFAGKRRLLLPGFALGVLAALTHPSAAILLLALLVAPWLGRSLGLFPDAYQRPALWTALLYLGCGSLFAGLGWALEIWLEWNARKGTGTPLHLVASTGYLVGPVVGAFGLAGAWLAFRNRPHPALLAVLVAGVGAWIALAAAFFTRVSAQYVFVLLPWLAAIAAVPVAAWGEWRRGPSRPASTGALVALVVLLLPSAIDTGLYFTVRNGDRPRWREAYRYVFENRRPGDLVMGMEAPVGEYYFDPRADELRGWRNVTWLDRFRAPLLGTWARQPRRRWLVLSQELMQEYDPLDRERTRRMLREDYRLMAEFPIPWTPRDLDLEVYLAE
ncbi:MAG: glycosyltransferase family 39 protein [Planctomycetota bacterium]